jgi:hypothetical protein
MMDPRLDPCAARLGTSILSAQGFCHLDVEGEQMQGGEQQYLAADIDADTESGRLQLLEACHDPGTIRRLDRLGVSRGWRCLELGAGYGSIARWLAERVGPTGSVVAADIDPRFLTNMPAGVEVRRLDIRHDDLEVDTYDLVHCRAVPRDKEVCPQFSGSSVACIGGFRRRRGDQRAQRRAGTTAVHGSALTFPVTEFRPSPGGTTSRVS